MDPAIERRERVDQLVALAKVYRGWNRNQVARALRRDPSRLAPASGIPKLDWVFNLATMLDWPVEEVATFLLPDDHCPTHIRRHHGVEALEDDGAGFDALQISSREARRQGRHLQAVTLARNSYAAASAPEQRALACHREAAGWEGLGHFTSAVEAQRRGLTEPSIPTQLRRILESSLASAYYALSALTEARSLAKDLIDAFGESPPTGRGDRAAQALAHFVHGNALRRMMATDPDRARRHARGAVTDLETSGRLYSALAGEFGVDVYAGLANTCRGGVIEAGVTLGRRDVSDGLAELADALERVEDPCGCPTKDLLESYGWWCIFGSAVALRRLSDPRSLSRHLARFTSAAQEIADRLDHWFLRERIFTMRYAGLRFQTSTGCEASVNLDHHGLRELLGTMRRFPAFRETGWRLLEAAKIVPGG